VAFCKKNPPHQLLNTYFNVDQYAMIEAEIDFRLGQFSFTKIASLTIFSNIQEERQSQRGRRSLGTYSLPDRTVGVFKPGVVTGRRRGG